MNILVSGASCRVLGIRVKRTRARGPSAGERPPRARRARTTAPGRAHGHPPRAPPWSADVRDTEVDPGGRCSGRPTRPRRASVVRHRPVHGEGYRTGNTSKKHILTYCRRLSCKNVRAVARVPVVVPGLGGGRRRTTRARSSRRRWRMSSRTRSKRRTRGRTCSSGDGDSCTIGRPTSTESANRTTRRAADTRRGATSPRDAAPSEFLPVIPLRRADRSVVAGVVVSVPVGNQ